MLAVVGWMVWTGFDAGRLLGGFYKSEAEERRLALEAQVTALEADNRQLLSKLTRLDSEAQMNKGAQDSLARQALTLQTENTQLKEELSYLQQLVAGSGKEGAISLHRATVEQDGPQQIRVRMLVVQGGARGDPFSGQLGVALELQQDGRRIHLNLPDDQPETGMALKLAFKYYQRIDVAVKVGPGATVRALQMRVFQTGNLQPRATQTINLP
ncbi:MAG: DUF6776 family protein [Betaproteobacteria bacterium]